MGDVSIYIKFIQSHERRQANMFYGQTSNWRKIVEEVTEERRSSLPAIAAQYADSLNAIRVHCGAEAQVHLHCQIFLVTEEDFDAFESFLKRFSLPQNGYQVVNTHQPYVYSASAAVVNMEQPLLGPINNQRHP
jgi:hypothetical protein